MSSPRPCSEFPNDNPALHDGVVWRCVATRGAPRAVMRLAKAIANSERPAPARVDVAEPAPSGVARAPSAALAQAAAPDGFPQLIAAIVAIALERGATRAAALAQALLRGEAIDGGHLAPELLDGLVQEGLVVKSGSRVTPSSALIATRDAWQGILDGQGTELPSGLDTPLDEWAATLLVVLLPEHDGENHKEDLRRELRRRGVAAFGLLEPRSAAS